jgi:hypothetical protein
MREWSSIARCRYSQPTPRGVALVGPVAGDPVTDPVELAQLLDVDVDDLARRGSFIAARRLDRLQRCEPVEAEAPENAFPDDRTTWHWDLSGLV